ncbi:PGAP1-like protein-domain-containing protein [Circinella umbellata]|nr:PGAP1-like protein-domain-containing protein [Circinella umbellata]
MDKIDALCIIYTTKNKSKSVPALFIPGHAGSYKQVRSIAATSSSYYKQKQLNGERIDYFTVDLNEEFSAISGQLLFDQAEYLNDAIEKILSLYDPSKTSSVLIVGHSMGGIVARLMLTLPNYRPNTINTILTLATPHTIPPIVLGPKMARVYDQISFSSTVFNNNNNNITLISLAGGTSDSIVNSDSAILPIGKERLTVFSTAIPKVWTSCDHMAILWCNQLVRVVAAALVDSVQQQPQDLIKPIQTFERHFIHPSLNFPRLPDVTSDTPQLTVLSIPKDRIGNTLVFDLITNDSQGSVRVFLCKGSKCITDITSMIKLLPSSTSGDRHAAYHGKPPFRVLHLEQQYMEDYDHVGVWQYEKDNPETFIAAKIEQEATTNIIVNKSNWDLVAHNGVSFNITAPQLYMTVQFPKISNPLLSYKLTLEWIKDSSDHQEEQGYVFAPIIQQNIGGESKYHVGLDEDNVSIDINFHASGDDNDTNFLQLQFWKLPGNVHGRAHLQIDWYGSLGKIVLRYGPSVVMFSFITALVVAANENMDFIYPLVGLVALTSISSLVFGVPRGFTFWWLPSVFLCLGAGVLSLIWISVYSLACILSIFIPKRLTSYMTSMTVKRLILACSLASIRVIPVPVIITIIYIYWLFIVAAGSNNCTINHNNKIILMFFSSLLPYVVPEVVVYIQDLIIVGWKMPILSLVSVLDDIPMLSIVLLLVTWTHDMLSSRQVKCVLYLAIIYYTIFGYTQPYPLHTVIQKYMSCIYGSDN